METLGYITQQLKAGLHPSFMTKEEHAFLAQWLGDTWYEKWGYVEEDLTKIVTVC